MCGRGVSSSLREALRAKAAQSELKLTSAIESFRSWQVVRHMRPSGTWHEGCQTCARSKFDSVVEDEDSTSSGSPTRRRNGSGVGLILVIRSAQPPARLHARFSNMCRSGRCCRPYGTRSHRASAWDYWQAVRPPS